MRNITLKTAALVATLALAGCAESTVRMPDGTLHTCHHYLDGVVLWDSSDTDEATDVCVLVGAERMVGGAK